MAEGKTLMVLGTEKEILSIIAVADEMRESSKEVISKLNRMGFETVMLRTKHSSKKVRKFNDVDKFIKGVSYE